MDRSILRSPASGRFTATWTLALVMLGAPLVARGDKVVVVVEPFVGAKAAAIASKVVANVLKDKVELVAPRAGEKAVDARAEAVVSGAEVKGKGLFITVKGTRTKKVEKLFYAEVGGRIPLADFERVAQQVPVALESAIGHSLSAPAVAAVPPAAAEAPAAPAPPKEPFANPFPETPATPKSPAAPTPPEAPAPPEAPRVTISPAPATPPAATAPPTPAVDRAATGERPALRLLPWSPGFELRASFLLSGRRFEFAENKGPNFQSSVTPGLRLDAQAFPYALHAGDERVSRRALAGLGLGGFVDIVFWPDTPANCRGASDCPNLATREFRAEAGLRWRFNLMAGAKSPQLLVRADYGTHQFSIQKKKVDNRLVDDGVPDVNYQYLTVGAGIRVPLVTRLAVGASFQYHAVMDQGDIQQPSEYGVSGKGTAWGIRADLTVEARLYGPLHLRAGGFYERFTLSFLAPPTGAILPSDATAALDQYYGAFMGLAYLR